jgi:hypothetical protein
VSPLEHSGVGADGEPGGLAHLFQPGPRRDGARLVEPAREEQREGFVHGGLLDLDGGAHPGRGGRAAAQAQQPVERADASLLPFQRVPVGSAGKTSPGG